MLKHWRKILFALVVFVLLHGILDFVEARWLASAVRSWEQTAATIGKVNEPPPPYEQDAVQFYLAAQLVIGSPSYILTTADLLRRELDGGSISAARLTAARTLLSRYSEGLHLLDVAAGMPFTGFAPERRRPFADFHNDGASALQIIRAFVGLADGSIEQTVHGMEGALLLNLRARRPMHVHTLFTWIRSWENPVIFDLQSILAQSRLTESDLARLADVLAKLDDDDEFLRFLTVATQNDILMYFGRLRPNYGSLTNVGLVSFDGGDFDHRLFRPFVARDLRAILADRPRLLEAAHRPWPDRFDALMAACEPSRSLRRFLLSSFWPVSGIAASVYPPGGGWPDDDPRWPRLQVQRWMSSLAMTRAARVAVALERYRVGNKGVLPESLNALIPRFLDRVPIDPFSGGPIRWIRSNGTSVVYSVGLNRQDDGGNEAGTSTFIPDPGWFTAVRPTGDFGLRLAR